MGGGGANMILELSKTELDYIIASVSTAHAHSFYGAGEADRIKIHGDKYLFWKRIMQKLESAPNQKGLEQWGGRSNDRRK